MGPSQVTMIAPTRGVFPSGNPIRAALGPHCPASPNQGIGRLLATYQVQYPKLKWLPTAPTAGRGPGAGSAPEGAASCAGGGGGGGAVPPGIRSTCPGAIWSGLATVSLLASSAAARSTPQAQASVEKVSPGWTVTVGGGGRGGGGGCEHPAGSS